MPPHGAIAARPGCMARCAAEGYLPGDLREVDRRRVDALVVGGGAAGDLLVCFELVPLRDGEGCGTHIRKVRREAAMAGTLMWRATVPTRFTFSPLDFELSSESDARSLSNHAEETAVRSRPARCSALLPLMSVSVAKLPAPAGSCSLRTIEGILILAPRRKWCWW